MCNFVIHGANIQIYFLTSKEKQNYFLKKFVFRIFRVIYPQIYFLKLDERMKAKSEIKMRLLEFLDNLSLSQSSFEKSVGLSNGWCNNLGDSIREAQNLLSVEITRSKVINCSSERLKALQELKKHVDYIKYELNGQDSQKKDHRAFLPGF